MEYTTHEDGALPIEGQIFVFGSNLSGYHGGGAARFAHQTLGAEWGIAEGRSGMTYAIPTKDKTISSTLSLEEIKRVLKILT